MAEYKMQSMYRAIREKEIKNGAGYWSSQLVGIYYFASSQSGTEGVRIGEYVRDYHDKIPPFSAFEKDGKHYALYSRHYTCTRVMSLPDCVDIGGEDETDAWNFCPVELWVPEDNISKEGWPDIDMLDDSEDKESKRWLFGLVAGCVWGDDSKGWKIQYFDLSQADKGILTREEKFGYIYMGGRTLQESVLSISDGRITFAAQQEFDLKSGHNFEIDNNVEKTKEDLAEAARREVAFKEWAEKWSEEHKAKEALNATGLDGSPGESLGDSQDKKEES